jgi:hypothetical protein
MRPITGQAILRRDLLQQGVVDDSSLLVVSVVVPAKKARASLGQLAAPVFTGASSDITVPSCFLSLPSFPMWPALPASEYYDGSAPTRVESADVVYDGAPFVERGVVM